MIIHKIIPSVYYNLWLKCFDTQLNKLSNPNLVKFPNLFGPRNKKILF